MKERIIHYILTLIIKTTHGIFIFREQKYNVGKYYSRGIYSKYRNFPRNRYASDRRQKNNRGERKTKAETWVCSQENTKKMLQSWYSDILENSPVIDIQLNLHFYGGFITKYCQFKDEHFNWNRPLVNMLSLLLSCGENKLLHNLSFLICL